MSRLAENATLVVMLLLTVNVLGLNLWVISQAHQEQGVAAAIQLGLDEAPQPICDGFCQDGIVTKMIQRTPTEVQEYVPTKSDEKAKTPHEWYISLGGGSTQSQDWVEIPGAEVTIDTENYPSIQRVTFEAYLAIPTANGAVSAKLYNVTRQHDVWFSDVSGETEKITGKQANISLDPGKNLYRVKMKTTMGYQAVLSNARIIILTE
jgi:hypothetical protein